MNALNLAAGIALISTIGMAEPPGRGETPVPRGGRPGLAGGAAQPMHESIAPGNAVVTPEGAGNAAAPAGLRDEEKVIEPGSKVITPGAAGKEVVPGGATEPLGAKPGSERIISPRLDKTEPPIGNAPGGATLRGRSGLTGTPGASRAVVTPSIDAGNALDTDPATRGRGRAFGGTQTPANGATPDSRPDTIKPGQSLPPGLSATPDTMSKKTPNDIMGETGGARPTPRLSNTPSSTATPADRQTPATRETPTATNTPSATMTPSATATPAVTATPSRTMSTATPTGSSATPSSTGAAGTTPVAGATPASSAATPFVPTGTPPSGAGQQVGKEERKMPHSTATPGPYAGTISASPTPGSTPVATPAGATPTPANWNPSRDWRPYAGWSPPAGWHPPVGWNPPGGWNPPPGWNPPAEWSPRLFHWGWNYISGRGWVVPNGWRPPVDFVTPPGWYYLPQQNYSTYGFYNPASVVIVPGAARRDLITQIDTTQAYMPPEELPAVIEDLPAPPARPLPEAPPQMTEVQSKTEVVETLTRPRTGDRYTGPVLVTQTIHFDYDSYAIKPDSFTALDAIGDALVNPPLDKAIINVEGHTDSDGTNEYNQTLSERRAWSVKSYLVQKFGIDPNRLVIVGYGEEAPISNNDTDNGKALNRRVEFENVTNLYQNQQSADAAPDTAAPAQTETRTETKTETKTY